MSDEEEPTKANENKGAENKGAENNIEMRDEGNDGARGAIGTGAANEAGVGIN
jgi:hypothetical protein